MHHYLNVFNCWSMIAFVSDKTASKCHLKIKQTSWSTCQSNYHFLLKWASIISCKVHWFLHTSLDWHEHVWGRSSRWVWQSLPKFCWRAAGTNKHKKETTRNRDETMQTHRQHIKPFTNTRVLRSGLIGCAADLSGLMISPENVAQKCSLSINI